MFSIAAINDTDSRGQWEPLAPTKEAQEFHLTQAYHDGLLKLQAKDYEKARELLESVLKDPLISNAEVDNNTTDGHLLQLKFLVLKNLATVFLQQGSGHYESALRCYLQAVEIDNKDSVVWNQLGTLSCSMGSLSISRWAFEQGLLCSPNNWNCMEKLLEVLIAIGDEVTCLSVAELILRHWPSHSRALHVKNTIEETESAPFAPRGIDKLEPKHVRLKFHDKRKAPDENLDEGTALKKLNQNIELQIAEASWAALIDGLLGILLPLNGCGSEVGTGKLYRSGDVRLSILFPPCAEIVMEPVEKKEPTLAPSGESMPPNDNDSQRASNSKEKESNLLEEQPQERRSTRLESLRSRKPGKEELDFTAGKDFAKIVLQLLEPFVISKPDSKGSEDIGNFSVSCADQANSLDMESRDVANFVRETSKNYGAYHIGHLLLEHAASKNLVCLDAHVKFLELEKLLRNWGQDRTPECSLFLAELYYDIGSSPSNSNNLSEFLSEASYHLCKIIESVALDHPFHSTFRNKNFSSFKSFQGTDAISPDSSICESSHLDSSLLSNKSPFWARYFWLSGKLSVRDGNKAKAYEEFCISMSLLAKNENADNSCMVQLPHCKISKELTVERILHEINLLKVDFLLEKTLGEMIEKEVFVECVTLLAPLLFSANSLSPSLASDPKGDGVTPVELSALDILIKACQKIKPMDMEVYLTSHTRKLQILMALAGMGECVAFGKAFHQKSVPKMLSGPEMVSSDGTSKHWNDLVTEEVKEILQCVSQVKNFIDQSGESNGIGLVSIFSDIQSLLLAIMYNIANNVLCKKSSMQVNADHLEQKQSNCFIDAAIAFCKLQHLDSSVTVKSQVELIVATHDLLAEYGLCCAGEGGEGEEATFLKFAIKHLLALDMKLKSSFNSSSREISPDDRQPSNDNDFKTSENEISSDKKGERMCGTHNSESITAMKDDIEGITSKGTPSFSGQEKDNAIALQKQCTNVDKINLGEKCGHQLDEGDDELSEDEKEELELMIDNALDQCFFCLYGLNLRSDSSYDDELAVHKNTSRGDYQTKEQCADVFQYILPSAKASSRTGLVKLRRVLRTIRKHFPQPPEEILAGNIIDKFFDADLCEEELSEMAGSEGYLETVTKMLFPDGGNLKQYKASLLRSSEPYLDVYSNLYYFLAQSEEMNATDKWPGFVLTKEGEEFVQQNANLFKYDLLYNPLRFESWQRLANIYDEEVDLLLNDGSKHINVSGWRKNITLPQRVETSRRRSRRCLLISLALAKTSEQQCEIHELLALVYYDSLQNVVPFYDQRSLVPSRDAVWRIYCENSMRHFKKALMHKQDWSHAFYIGKLCEKLGYSYETSLSYYDKAIALNPSAVDPFYRMHASRLKLLWNCGKQNVEVLKVLSTYFFSQSLKDAAMDIISKITPETSLLEEDKLEKTEKREEVWNMLYNDCLSALEICVGGDLKHFHKARFMLAQGLYKKGGRGDLQKAKDELSFCFRSSRSCFTINMWEIDGMVKKGKRKAPGLAGNKKALEVNLPESSRKFITCIRKYLLFYLKLLEETGDICTLDRAYVSLRSDKRFSLCIEDLVPVALGRHIKALVLSINQVETAATDPASSFEHQLEKIFGLFMEQGTLWPEICSLPEIRSPEISESSLYGYLHQYIVLLERNGKLETLEAINERIRKRFKNPKLSNSNCAKVCRHASSAWYRSIIIGLASITPLQSGFSNEVQTLSQPTDGVVESSQQLCVDLQTHEIWNSSFEDSTHLESLQAKWNPTLAKINNIVIKKASDGDLETANSLLRSSYNFYRESSCVMLPSSLNLSLVPSRLVKEKQFPLSIEGVEPLDLSIPRKLLLWAYALLNGRYASISVVVKYCEENAKLKMKRGTATSSAPQNTNTSIAASSHTAAGSGKEAASHGGGSEVETTVVTSGPPVVVSESDSRHSANPLPSSSEGQRSLLMAPQLHPCNNNEGERERSSVGHEGDDTNKG